MRDSLPKLHVMPTVERAEPVFVRGQGSWLWDAAGNAYLDFYQGAAANSLGHSPKSVVDALQRQAEVLLNPGPTFYNRNLIKLAARLCQATGSDQAYFLNSGAEANAAAVQLARKWGQTHKGGARRIVRATGSSHGLAMPAQTDCIDVPYNDFVALQQAVDDSCVALLLEPVQAEQGVTPASLEYLQGAARLCREQNLLLILDEVQTGLGRCGALLAEERYGVRADILTLGKGLGAGVPLAALLARGNACAFAPGDIHGTLHGNPLMTAAGLCVLQTVLEPGFLEHVREIAEHLKEGLERFATANALSAPQGHGLLLGLELAHANQVSAYAMDEGLLIHAPTPQHLCFSPALTVSHTNVDEMLRRLTRAFRRVAKGYV